MNIDVITRSLSLLFSYGMRERELHDRTGTRATRWTRVRVPASPPYNLSSAELSACEGGTMNQIPECVLSYEDM